MSLIKMSASSARYYLQDIGEKLRIARINRNSTQEEVAKRCQCSVLTIQRLEKGEGNVGCLYLIRYIMAVGAEAIFAAKEEIFATPIFEKHTVRYKKRIRKNGKN